MSRYELRESKFGNYKTLILSDELNGTKAEIALKGATLLNYFVPVNNKLLNIVDGYQTPEEFDELAGARSSIMAPFSNRIKRGTYEFDGKLYQLISPINPNKDVIHGLVRVIDFEIKDIETIDDKISLTLFTNKIRKEAFPGYPFNLDVTIKFTLKENTLDVEISGLNINDAPIPFACGWHPYFKTNEDGIDNLILQLPANKIVLLDEKYIPLIGEKAYSNLDEHPELDFRTDDLNKNTLGKKIVNVCYTDIIPDLDGFARTKLTDEITGIQIIVFQKGGVIYAFTGDEVKYRPRKSIAIEPVEYITNSYNRPELSDKIILKPGQLKTFKFGVEIKKL
ncbi:MAG: aldose 1-epimerase [Ignavibacteriales bacterium]|nr:aldose 1-epimerase [Ignavibacteriales bacterium]